MSKLRALVRAGLKSNFGFAVFCHRFFKEKKDRWLVPVFALSLLGLVPMLYGLLDFIQTVYSILKPIGQERALLALGVLAGQLLILIFGFYYVIAAFYFSRDIEMLIPLPIRPSEALLSKFIVIAINEYISVAIIVLPFIIKYGFLAKGGISYWMISILVYMALPLIPLAVISVIVMVMMRFINISRKKDLLILVGGIAVLAAAIGFQILTQQASSGGMTAKEIAVFLASPNSLVNRIGAVFPPSIWAAKAIAGGFSAEGLNNLAALLGVSLLSFAAIILLAEYSFYRGVIGLTEMSGRKKRLTTDEMSRRVSSGRRAISAIFMREVRIMNRTPVFLLNGVLAVVILPALFLIMARSNLKSPSADLQKVLESGNSLPVILFTALFMVVCGCIGGASASSFSREGAQFWISNVIPVPARKQVMAKFLHSFLINLLGILMALTATLITLPMKPIHLGISAGLAVITGVLLTAVGMIIDLARPLLDWTNPQKAMKQNLNVLLALLANAAILTGFFFGIKALMKTRAEQSVIIFVLSAALAGLAAASYLALLKFADRRYPEIDN